VFTVVILHCQQNMCQTEGWTGRKCRTNDKHGLTLPSVYVNSPNDCEIAFFMITSWHRDCCTVGPTAVSLGQTCLPIPVSYNIFGTTGFKYLAHAVRLKWSSFLNCSNILWSWVAHSLLYTSIFRCISSLSLQFLSLSHHFLKILAWISLMRCIKSC